MTKTEYTPVVHTCSQCNATWSGAERAHCCQCHKTFNSTYAFDRHRTGSYEEGTRRCMTKDEMVAKGMQRQKDGYWVTELQDVEEGKTRSVGKRA